MKNKTPSRPVRVIGDRSIGLCVVLSVLTLGIYAVYWQYTLVKSVHALKKNKNGCAGEMLCLIFVPFYAVRWWSNCGKQVRAEFNKRGYDAYSNKILFLLLALSGAFLFPMIILQSDLNTLPHGALSYETAGKRRREKFSFGAALINAPYFLWAALFIIIPLIVVLFYAFTDGEGNFTVSNMAALGDYGGVILRSLWYSVLATAITLVVAYPFSYIVCKLRPASQKIANMFVTLPMWINLLIKTYCLSAIMDRGGLINQALVFLGFGRLPLMNNTGAVIFGMVYNYLPYMILPIYNAMSKIDVSLLEASEDLGCSPISRIRRVVMPLTLPGVVSGIIMVFVPSVSTFYISAKMGGTGDFMIGDLIEGQIHNQNNNLPVAAALSTVLMLIILVSMLVLNRVSGNEEGGGVPI